jgi:hypothetical protein
MNCPLVHRFVLIEKLKLKEAPHLNNQIKSALAQNLSATNGELLTNVLDLLKKHKVADLETVRIMARML